VPVKKEDLLEKNGFYIEFATEKKPRKRKVISRSKSHPTWKYPSWKKGRMIHCESELERDACRRLDVDLSVFTYGEQGVCITYKLNNEIHRHYPDFFVETSMGKIFKEVKYEDDANLPEISERTEYLSKVLPIDGYRYEVITEAEIRKQPRMDNAVYLLRRGRQPVDVLAHEALRQYSKIKGDLCWGNLTKDKSCPINLFQVCRLILEGYLMISLDEVWHEHTPVFLSSSNKKRSA